MRIPRGRLTVVLTAAALLTPSATAAAKTATGSAAKLDTDLAGLVGVESSGRSVQAYADARDLTVTPGERVLVEVYATPAEATTEARLDAAGADVLATAPGPGRLSVASAWVPVDGLGDVAAAPGVRAVLPVQGAGTDAGAVQSQGDASHNGPAARALGATGAGVKVGVISDSIDQVGGKVAGSKASGDLPANVTVISDATGGSDEGRAMAEIVYDTAPGITQMAFASGTASGAAGKVSAIDALVADGAKVIADDIFYLSEPFFQDGQIAQAADRARAAGVLYFASAGNRARQSYESAPRFPAGGDVAHDFDPGAATDTIQSLVTVPNGSFVQVALQWDEAWGRAKHDIDLELVNVDAPTPALAMSTTDNTVTTLPSELATWTNATGSAVTVGVRIKHFAAAPGAPEVTRLKYIARGNFGSFGVAEHATASDTINPDAAAATGALAVAAVAWNDAGLNTPESFSSRGPKTRLFDAAGGRLAAPEVRQKPELAAADAVSTSVPGFGTFLGTSAAAPSAAGVAALVLSARPSLPYSLLRAIMTDPRNTSDCTASGLPDLDCGWGFVFADRAVAQAKDTTPPSVSANVQAPPGANGWSRGDVAVTWSVADAQSPSEQLSCPAPTITTDGSTTVTCQARSAGGTATGSTVVRRDATPPAAPVIAGMAATTYAPGAVPPASGVSCASSDATSGLESCVVTGHGTTPGAHTLTATARDVAGNTRTATLTYTVAAALDVAQVRLRGADVVSIPSAKACVKRTARLKLRIKRPRGTTIRTVKVKVTGLKRTITMKKPGTVTLPKLRRKRVSVRVTVTLADGRKVTVTRTYRRC